MKKTITDGFIDIHCHIIPGVDDGAKDMSMSMQMLDIAYKEGFRGIIATPHYHPGKSLLEYDKLLERFQELKSNAKNIHPDMRLYLGREVYFTQDAMEAVERGEKLTIGDSRYMLIEYSPLVNFNHIRMSINDVLMSGLTPVIAHVERYACLLEDIDRVDEMKDMGAVIQVNASSVMGNSGRKVKKFLKKLLKEQIIDAVATDAHSNGSRAPKIRECADYLVKKVGQDYAEKLLIDNPQRILDGRYLEETD